MASSFSALDIQRMEASQYVSAVGLVIMLWDHILTFPDEVQFIWRAKPSIPKVLFLFNRYVIPFVMIIQSYEFSGTAPYLSLGVSTFRFPPSRWGPSTLVQFCKVWYSITVVVGMLSIATSNFLILLRLWVLWNRSPRLMLGTLTFFIVTQIVALSLAGYVVHEMLPTLVFDPLLRVCIPMTKPKFVMLWAPGIAFEVMVFLTTVCNALDRPRSRNTQMAKIMYRDGSMYFFGLFALRVINMVLSLAAPISLMFLGVFFIWSIANITLARLILNLRRLPSDSCDTAEYVEELPDFIKNGVEDTELPELRRYCDEREDPELHLRVPL